MSGAAVVRGTVQGTNGRPVADARVVVTVSPVPVPEIAYVTDTAGRFAFTAPAPGAYVFEAYADDVPGTPATASLQVPASSSPPTPLPPLATDADDNVDMSSDDPAPGSAPAVPAPELHLVLTFPSDSP